MDSFTRIFIFLAPGIQLKLDDLEDENTNPYCSKNVYLFDLSIRNIINKKYTSIT